MKRDSKGDTPQKLAKNGESPLLDVRQLSLSFGSKTVVDAISFTLNRGEKLALVGESGSGKTVTALSLLRLLPNSKTQGHAYFQGREPCDLLALPETEMRGLRGRDIAMIFQEPMTALNPLLTIGTQIAEVLVLKRALTRQQAQQAAIALLADTGISEPARRAEAYPHQLSGGQRQRAVIAMALACEPQLLLADEPTTALDVSLRGQILDLLSHLQQRTGMAVLLITHDLNLVRRFADRVAVMENGLIVEQGAVAEVFARPQHPYTQKLLDSRPVRNVVEVLETPSAAGIHPPSNEPLKLPPWAITAQQLRVAYPTALKGWRGWFQKSEFVALSNAAFSLAPATTLGVIGESGSGKSTLAQAVLGLHPFQGDMHVLGQMWDKNPLRNSRNNKAMRRQIQVVFQDPFSSLSPRLTIEEIVAEGLQVHADICLPEARQALVLKTLEEVGLSADQFPGILQRYPHEFSGGQRQRIAIARALILNPKILVLDEPTSALDVTIQKQVLQLLQRLQKEKGLSYLLITHDVDVVRAMAHHVIVIKNGTILESGSVSQVLNCPQNPYTQALVAAAEGF